MEPDFQNRTYSHWLTSGTMEVRFDSLSGTCRTRSDLHRPENLLPLEVAAGVVKTSDPWSWTSDEEEFRQLLHCQQQKKYQK